MGRTIIFSAGTSILGGLKRNDLTLQEGHETASVTAGWINGLRPEHRYSLSAEISTMAALHVTTEDRAALLTTASSPGPLAARLVARAAKLVFDIDTQLFEIDDLSLDDAHLFRSSGLPGFVTELDRIVNDSRTQGYEPIIGVGSGVKLVLPYLALYGMMRRVGCAYVYETGRQLLWLPRLPLSVDAEALRAGARVLTDLDTNVAIPRTELRNRLADSYESLEGLFEPWDADNVTLSAFGLLVLADLQTAATTPVYLSPAAVTALEAADGIAKSQFHFMLDRIRNPLWRAAKYHRFEGTDLDVYKPGNTAQRAAAWLAHGAVYVAELYPNHDQYELELPGRNRKNYDRRGFQLSTLPRAGEALLTEEQENQRLFAELQQQVDEAHDRHAQAEQTVEGSEQALTELANREQYLQEELGRLSTERDREARAASELRNRFAAMTLAQRLRWLLTGRYD